MKEIIIAIIAIVPSMATLLVSIINNRKIKKQTEIREEMAKQEASFRNEMKKRDNAIYQKLDELNGKIDNVDRKNDLNRRKELRSKLVKEYVALIHGANRSPQEMQDIEDDWHEYRFELNGDSYVEDLHDVYVEMRKSQLGGNNVQN